MREGVCCVAPASSVAWTSSHEFGSPVGLCCPTVMSTRLHTLMTVYAGRAQCRTSRLITHHDFPVLRRDPLALDVSACPCPALSSAPLTPLILLLFCPSSPSARPSPTQTCRSDPVHSHAPSRHARRRATLTRRDRTTTSTPRPATRSSSPRARARSTRTCSSGG